MFNVKKLISAAEELGAAKNIEQSTIRDITVQALERAYIRILTGGNQPDDLPDPKVKVVLDEEKGTVDFYQIKTIKKDVEDDMLEIDLEDAQEIFPKKKLDYDQDIEIHDDNIDIDELSKIFIKQFKNAFHQRLNDAEKAVLYDTYKDHIGEIVIGTVEKVEDRAVTVNIGKNNVYLTRKEMIGDETFTVGQQIKLYLDDVSTEKKGSIQVTRAAPGFLKRLFEEEIHEIYDGTIVIKGIARRAGKRSKVAVYSNDPDVDATGSCIGKDGSRINKVVNQLGGNGRDKEKIDIVAWNEDPSLYIIDALRPAEVVGINIDQDDEEAKEATCIVKDGQYSKAIGLRGVNVRLAVQLTGYDLTILEETPAKEEGLKYTTKEELDAKDAERKEAKRKSDFAKHSLEYKAEKEKEAELKKVADNATASKEEAKVKRAAAKKAKKTESEEVTPVATGPVSSLEEELAKAKAAATRAQKRAEEHVEIKTTTNILDLEKQLEKEKEEEAKKSEKKTRRPRKITESEVPNEEKKDKTDEKKEEVKKMDIYTEEELREIEAEENENAEENFDEEDDVDYDEFDEYYDEEK
ncbi:MAG: transcription termination factor NusA [Bacilli bacterium]|nr:transcription termination factor NusA [Bacilli bacterium]